MAPIKDPKPACIALIENLSEKQIEVTMSLLGAKKLLWNTKITAIIEPKLSKTVHYPNPTKKFMLKIMCAESVLYKDTINVYKYIQVTGDSAEVITKRAPMEIVEHNEQNDHDQLIALFECDNWYHVLQVPPTADQSDIDKAYRRLALIHHPDRNEGSIKSKIMFQKISECYKQLSDETSRKQYDRVLVIKAGVLSWDYWKMLLEDKKRLGSLFVTTAFIGGGIAIIFCTAGLATPIVISCGIVGSAVIGGGSSGFRYLISPEAAVNGVKWDKLAINVGVGSTISAAIGGIATPVGIAISNAFAAGVAQPIAGPLIDGAVSGTLTGALWGAGSNVTAGFTTARWDGMTNTEKAMDIAKGAAIGALGGVVGGALTGLGQGIQGELTAASTAVDEIIGGAAGAANTPLRRLGGLILKSADPMIGLTLRKAVNYVEEGNSDSNRAPFRKLSADPNNMDLSHNFIAFENVGLFKSRCLVHYNVKDEHREDIEKLEILKSGDLIKLPIDARQVQVSFESLRFLGIYCVVKKWNRNVEDFVNGKEPEIFKYDVPPQRRFILDGTLYFEKITFVYNERSEVVDR